MPSDRPVEGERSATETEDYPGLIVSDGRVSGSITVGRSRLPLWAIVTRDLVKGWDEVEGNIQPSEFGWDGERFFDFVHHLFEARKEFARLLCILADVERQDSDHSEDPDAPWDWQERHSARQRVLRQLRICASILDPNQPPIADRAEATDAQ